MVGFNGRLATLGKFRSKWNVDFKGKFLSEKFELSSKYVHIWEIFVLKFMFLRAFEDRAVLISGQSSIFVSLIMSYESHKCSISFGRLLLRKSHGLFAVLPASLFWRHHRWTGTRFLPSYRRDPLWWRRVLDFGEHALQLEERRVTLNQNLLIPVYANLSSHSLA